MGCQQTGRSQGRGGGRVLHVPSRLALTRTALAIGCRIGLIGERGRGQDVKIAREVIVVRPGEEASSKKYKANGEDAVNYYYCKITLLLNGIPVLRTHGVGWELNGIPMFRTHFQGWGKKTT